MIDLSGKTYLVTHADQQAGRATAEACLRAGAHVLAHYDPARADGDELARAIGVRRSAAIAADLHIPEHPLALWHAALDRVNRIDGLINVAGVYKPSFLEGGDLAWMESWRRAVQVNLTAPADLCRAAIPHFRANGGGAIVTLSPPAEKETGGPLDAACIAARGGLVALVRTLSRAFAREGVAFYIIAPDEADPARPPQQQGELRDWVRMTPYPSIRDATGIGELAAMMCAEAAPVSARLWDEANLGLQLASAG